ncbi:hypothetical protein HP550_14435 [Cellulomonas humilata]|uniref:Uncharacterized protein n=1 Tax=Cellulomonas humilata TaxID=144055 RepID=A0A7Y6A2B6_9CELL|nr:DUF6361 family protein [Cellulomonas humilata]NUU18451.1 hypothetical protein [Cellulomonas humilata]
MTSTFGWLDTDDEQRRKMLEVVDLFKEEGTVDELGIGSIRDALADALFPGTSVLHTRLRYVLFVPWLMQRAAQKPTPTEMSAEFRSLEFRLIGSLLAGGETLGVVGNRARGNLKRLPSGMYWSTLGAWGIRQSDFTSDAFFRRQSDYRQLVRRTAATDDPEGRQVLPGTGFDPHLPKAPGALLSSVDFALRPAEEEYLSDLIASSTKGSMLSWLVHHEPGNLPDYVWEVDNLDDAPSQLAELSDHARRFHTAIHGAALVYNLLLARKTGRDEAVAQYEGAIETWRDELRRTAALVGWSRTDWWATIGRQNPRVRPMTRQFVDRWLDFLESDVHPATSAAAASLVGGRERQIKGGRARLVNQSALDRWSGGSGLGRHEFRWTTARRHLEDLYVARAAS